MIDRRIRSGEFPLSQIGLVWLALCALHLAGSAANIAAGRFPDPDDSLRLIQVRDLLAGQSWFDLHQYRIDPPQGTWMHWSRLVDIPLAGLILLLSPMFGQPLAEKITLIAVPLLTMGVIIVIVGRLAWRLLGREVAIMACLCAGLMPMLIFQLQPMRIDHHGWQIAMVAAALFAISGRDAIKGGASAGVAMAAGLMISIELLPMSAAFGAVLAVRWLRDRKDRFWLLSYLQSLALGLVALFLLARGWSDLVQYCDVISPAHIGFFATVALGTGLVAAMPAMPRPALVAMLGLVGAAGIAVFGIASPACLDTPFGKLDPLVHDYWYVSVLEGQPVWQQKPGQALPVLLQVLVALGATIALHLRSYDWLRSWWLDYAILLLLSIVAGMFVWRSLAFAALIAMVPLGWLVTVILAWLRQTAKPLRKLGIVGILLAILMPNAPSAAFTALERADKSNSVHKIASSSCDLDNSVPLLNQLVPGKFFAPLDIGPALLRDSHHSVTATSHHRNEAAMHDVIEAYLSDEARARELIGEHKADYIVVCEDLIEPALYARDGGDDGFMSLLLTDRAPDWLEPVDVGASPAFRVWRINQP
jgi:hypothetical protein